MGQAPVVPAKPEVPPYRAAVEAYDAFLSTFRDMRLEGSVKSFKAVAEAMGNLDAAILKLRGLK